VEATEKRPKIALLSLFQSGEGEATKKRPKNNKKRPKMALLSLYLLYLYTMYENPGGDSPPAPVADAHGHILVYLCPSKQGYGLARKGLGNASRNNTFFQMEHWNSNAKKIMLIKDTLKFFVWFCYKDDVHLSLQKTIYVQTTRLTTTHN